MHTNFGYLRNAIELHETRQPTNNCRSDVQVIRDMNKCSLAFGTKREVNYD